MSDEDKEYQAYLDAQKDAALEAEYAEYLKTAGKAANVMDKGMERLPGGAGAMYTLIKRGVLPALDYTSSLGRGAAFGAYQELSGQDLGLNFMDVIKGKTPNSAELLKRAGVEEGGKANIPGLPKSWQPTGRGVGGFATDVLLDPLNLIPVLAAGRGAKAAANGAKSINAVGAGEGILDTLARPVTKAMEKTGESSWRSGLKKIDTEIANYAGREPVSDVLLKNNIHGNERQIYDQMNSLSEKLKGQRDAILNAADAAGASPDVMKSLENAKAYVAKLKAQADPRGELKNTIAAMESEIAALESSAARPAIASQPEIRMTSLEPQLMELPVSQAQAPLDPSTRMLREQQFTPSPEAAGYKAEQLGTVTEGIANPYQGEPFAFRQNPGESVINNPLDEIVNLPTPGKYTERVYRPAPYEVGQDFREVVLSPAKPGSPAVQGPNASQMTAWKSNSYDMAGKGAYQEAKQTPAYQAFEQQLGLGQKQAVEASIEDVLGQATRDTYSGANDDLGRLLTTRERQLMEAKKAEAKNAVTPVDGIVATMNKLAYPIKKTADLAKSSRVRTTGGKLLMDASQNTPEAFWRQLLLQPNDRTKEENNGVNLW